MTVCSRPEDGLRCRLGVKPPLKLKTDFAASLRQGGCLARSLPKGSYVIPVSPKPPHEYYVVGAYVKYRCEDGYTTPDTSRLVAVCQSDGIWSGNVLTCTRSAPGGLFMDSYSTIGWLSNIEGGGVAGASEAILKCVCVGGGDMVNR